jgi:hypothetical protein
MLIMPVATVPKDAGLAGVWGAQAGDAWGRFEGPAPCAYSVAQAWGPVLVGGAGGFRVQSLPKPELAVRGLSC